MNSFIKLKDNTLIPVSDFLKVKYGLGDGCSTFGNENSQMFIEIMKEAALEKALKIVAIGLKTEEELRKKLLECGYLEYAVLYAADKLKDYKYINDLDYAKQYIMSKKDGRLKIEYDLETKGIPKNIIEDIYSENAWIEEENMRYHMEKNKKKSIQQKYGLLIRRGFEKEKIKNILEIDNGIIL